jgi:hypothetical protein
MRAASREPSWNIRDCKCIFRVSSPWSLLLPRLSDWTFDALDSGVDCLGPPECLTVRVCVCVCTRGWRGLRMHRGLGFLNLSFCILLRFSKPAFRFAIFASLFLLSACWMHHLKGRRAVPHRRVWSVLDFYSARISNRTLKNGGTRWRSWLRHCATSRKVAGSIPDGVTMAVGWTQPLNRNETAGA